MNARCGLTLALALAVIASAHGAPLPTRYPLSVTDDSGARVLLPAAPRRIVSLTLPSDEVLLSLVGPERLLAVTTYAADPGVSNVAGQVAGRLRTLTSNVEAVVDLRPDLVIVANWSDPRTVSQLRAAGVPVYLMGSGLTVESIEQKILRLGLLTDESSRAADLVADMEARLTAVRARVSRVAAADRLRVMDYSNWGTSQGRGSSWDDIVALAGLVNAVGDRVSDEWGQVPLARESLLEIEPDILVVPGWIDGDPSGASAFLAGITKDPALRTLQAVRDNRVLMMPEHLRSSTSQYIVDAVEWLAHAAYPALVP
jgi:iron complex transport system substrate-binding protein